MLLSEQLDSCVVLGLFLSFDLLSDSLFLLFHLEDSGLFSLDFSLSPLFSQFLLATQLSKVATGLLEFVLV